MPTAILDAHTVQVPATLRGFQQCIDACSNYLVGFLRNQSRSAAYHGENEMYSTTVYTLFARVTSSPTVLLSKIENRTPTKLGSYHL